MNKQIIIGKQGNQPFAINDPKVSRRHAYLVIDDQGRMQLVDNRSTNGTFIYNGTAFIRITANQPYPVSPESMIQLGPDTRFHVKRLLAGVKKEPPVQPPKKVDISQLRAISDNYSKHKIEIESKTGMISGLSSCMILVSLLAGGVSNVFTSSADLGENKTIWQAVLTIGIAAVLIVTLLSFINRYKKKLILRRNNNEHEYALKYSCPNCKLSFKGKIYENVLAEGRCPKCKTIFYDSSSKN